MVEIGIAAKIDGAMYLEESDTEDTDGKQDRNDSAASMRLGAFYKKDRYSMPSNIATTNAVVLRKRPVTASHPTMAESVQDRRCGIVDVTCNGGRPATVCRMTSDDGERDNGQDGNKPRLTMMSTDDDNTWSDDDNSWYSDFDDDDDEDHIYMNPVSVFQRHGFFFTLEVMEVIVWKFPLLNGSNGRNGLIAPSAAKPRCKSCSNACCVQTQQLDGACAERNRLSHHTQQQIIDVDSGKKRIAV